jgi:hypothetical protein
MRSHLKGLLKRAIALGDLSIPPAGQGSGAMTLLRIGGDTARQAPALFDTAVAMTGPLARFFRWSGVDCEFE